MPRPYRNDLRAKQAAATREQIVVALLGELADHGAAFSLERVAHRAGVSLRTVSLHFPDRAAQLAAVAAHLEATATSEPNPTALGDLPAHAARVTHHAFSNPAALRAEAAIGKPRKARDQAIVRALAKQLDPATAKLVGAALSTVLSPETATALLDRHKLDPTAAEATVTWLVQIIVDAIRNGDTPASPLKRTRRS